MNGLTQSVIDYISPKLSVAAFGATFEPTPSFAEGKFLWKDFLPKGIFAFGSFDERSLHRNLLVNDFTSYLWVISFRNNVILRKAVFFWNDPSTCFELGLKGTHEKIANWNQSIK